jgi:hypothetical protein
MLSASDVKCEVGGMKIGRGNGSVRRKSSPVPLCPPKISHDLTWDRNDFSSKNTGSLLRHDVFFLSVSDIHRSPVLILKPAKQTQFVYEAITFTDN